jgi:hypothetical protein
MNLPAVEHNIEGLRAFLTDCHSGTGLPRGNCVPVVDESSAEGVWSTLKRAVDEADDLLLIYYAGHGVLDRRGRLFLGLPQTTRDPYHWTALDVAHIRELMAESRARNRVLIIDSCFSGRGFEAMGESNPVALATPQLEVAGTYTLTATSANTLAHSPDGQWYTAFNRGVARHPS